MESFKKIVLVCLVVLLSACSVPGTYFSEDDVNQGYVKDGKRVPIKVIELDAKWLAEYGAQPAEPYRIGPYDILNIIVWDHPELTTPTTQIANPTESGILVDSEGYIFFPFAGQMKVSGLTLNEARELLQEKLKTYIRDPQLSIRVAQFRSQEVEIVGEVQHPGILPITDRQLTAMQAINLSGGVNSITSKTQQIFILSEKNNEIVVYWFNAQNPAALIAAEKFRLHNNVIIYVPPAGVSAWNRVITQLIPTLGATSSTKSVADIE